MLLKAAKEYNIDIQEAIFIGDDVRDNIAGRAAGCKTILIKPNENLLDTVQTIANQ